MDSIVVEVSGMRDELASTKAKLEKTEATLSSLTGRVTTHDRAIRTSGLNIMYDIFVSMAVVLVAALAAFLFVKRR